MDHVLLFEDLFVALLSSWFVEFEVSRGWIGVSIILIDLDV